MSVVSALIPAEGALVGAAAAARPLLGLGLLAAVLIAFKPLLSGFLHAALLAVRPRANPVERAEREIREGVREMLRLAGQAEKVQPGLASELRAMASRY